MSRRLLPVVLFVVAGVLGWWLVWHEAPAPPVAEVGDEPEAELQPPAINLAPGPAKPTPAPTPELEPAQPGIAKEAPVPPQADDNEPPDPESVLDVPDHLKGKPEPELRKYYLDLKAHHEGMLEFARKRVEDLLDSQDPEQRAAGFRLRQDIKDAEEQVKVLERYLRDHPE